MMTEDQKRDKMLSLVDTLTERTNADKISWLHKEDGYVTPFDKGDSIEFSYNYEDDDENPDPVNFLLFFMNLDGVKYEGFYVLSPGHPGYRNFLSLYRAIKEQEEKEFLKKYEKYMANM